jgi:TonB C terminal
MKKIIFLLIIFFISFHAFSADWTLIYAHKSGVKWYSSNAVQLDDGTIRLFIKGVHPKRDSTPFAILLNCDTMQVRNFVAGDFGSEFFKPWQPITPDSVGEIAFDAFCKTPKGRAEGAQRPSKNESNGAKQSFDLNTAQPVEGINDSGSKQVKKPSASYAAKVIAAIRPNILNSKALDSNLIAEYVVNTNDDGVILKVIPLKLSGDVYWDDTALRAIIKTERLPRDESGKVPSPMVISLRPGE